MRKIKFTNNSHKKAEMSLTVVVSAVIALVVLIVLIYIFINGTKTSSSSFAACALNGGSCKSDCGTSGVLGNYACGGTDKCCVKTDWLACTEEDVAAGRCSKVTAS